MRTLDAGSGPPVIVIPGLQGRWEWMKPGLISLAERVRVISFSLADEPSSGHRFDAERGFDNYVDQIDQVLEHAGLHSAVVCGVSYGGLIALRYAARRPAMTRGLVLASALDPCYSPDRRARFYMTTPGLLFPVFCLDAAWRSRMEVRAALPERRARNRFRVKQAQAAVLTPTTPYRMVHRMRLLAGEDFMADATRVKCPTLVITGDPELDRVVPVACTLAYAELLPDVETASLANTGHLGIVTRPDGFRDLVAGFVERLAGGRHEPPSPAADVHPTMVNE